MGLDGGTTGFFPDLFVFIEANVIASRAAVGVTRDFDEVAVRRRGGQHGEFLDGGGNADHGLVVKAIRGGNPKVFPVDSYPTIPCLNGVAFTPDETSEVGCDDTGVNFMGVFAFAAIGRGVGGH